MSDSSCVWAKTGQPARQNPQLMQQFVMAAMGAPSQPPPNSANLGEGQSIPEQGVPPEMMGEQAPLMPGAGGEGTPMTDAMPLANERTGGSNG